MAERSHLSGSRPATSAPARYDGNSVRTCRRYTHGLTPGRLTEAVTYAANQWPSLLVYTRDGRLTIDNGPAEQAIRPLAVGRNNWLHVGGDGGLRPTAVLLGVAASVKRHGVNPWVYLRRVLTELPARRSRADLTDLLPGIWPRSGPQAAGA